MEQTHDDGVVQRLPAGLDDVLRDADGGPRALLINRVDQDSRDRFGAGAGVEHPDPVVRQMDGLERRESTPQTLAQRRVEGVYRAVPLRRCLLYTSDAADE